jgi:hypothetical protein
MNIVPLIIFIVLALGVVLLIRDNGPAYNKGSNSGGLSLFLLVKIALLFGAVFVSLTIMKDIIAVPVTFANVAKIAISIFLIYFTLSITAVSG